MLKKLCIGDWVRIGEEIFIVDNNEAGRFLRKFLVDGKPVENVASITIVANPGRAPTVTIYTIPRELVFNSEDEEETPDSV